jgi:hypothetical protein
MYLRKPSKLVINCPDGLLNRFLKRATDAHDLANTLHTATEQPAHAVELLQVPAGNLYNAIIQAGLEARACDFRDRVLDLVERNAKTELRSDEGERVAGRL